MIWVLLFIVVFGLSFWRQGHRHQWRRPARRRYTRRWLLHRHRW